MKEFKTLDEVLKKGQNQVNIPVIFIMLFIWFLFHFLDTQVVPEKFKTSTLFVGLLIGFILGWAYWSYKIVKWRIWAFKNTKKTDWAELKNRAVSQNLIWEDNSIFEKTEFRSKSEQKIIQGINDEIPTIEIDDSLNNIQDNLTIPQETKYYYAQSEIILSLILPVLFAVLGIYLIRKDNLIIGFLGLGLGIYIFDLDKIKNIWKKKIQLKLSNDGIYVNLDNWNLIKWNDTENIVIDVEQKILTLEAWKNDECFDITFPLGGLNIKNCDDLLSQINVYLKRNQLKMNNNSY